MKKKEQPIPQREEASANLERIIFLSDGIFAIALTLLALDLRLPDLPSLTIQDGLRALLPKLLIFLVAFFIIGNQWDVHQRTFLHISRANATFAWLNLLSLLFVVLVPAMAAILGRYPTEPLAMICFATNSALLGLASWLTWMHASRNRRLLDKQADPNLVQMISRLWLITPIVFVLTIPLTYVNVYLVYLLWLILPITSYVSIGAYLRGRKKRQS